MIGIRSLLAVLLASVSGIAGAAEVRTASNGDRQAVQRAVVAPFSALLRRDARGLCSDFVPAVAEKLFTSGGQDCEEAATHAFAESEMLDLAPHATVRSIYPQLGRAWANLQFGGGRTRVVALRHITGRWRVSSPMFTVKTVCKATAAGPCRTASKLLSLAILITGELTYFPAAVLRGGTRELREYETGGKVAAQTGCLACHRIGDDGNDGPGSNLTRVGSMLDEQQLEQALINPRAPMPSFRLLPRTKLTPLIRFLTLLR
jgi:mono/diheme cytochrome c family protein